MTIIIIISSSSSKVETLYTLNLEASEFCLHVHNFVGTDCT